MSTIPPPYSGFHIDKELASLKSKKGIEYRLKHLFSFMRNGEITLFYTYNGESSSFSFTVDHENNEKNELFDPTKYAHDEYVFISKKIPNSYIHFTLLVSETGTTMRSGLYLDKLQTVNTKSRDVLLPYKTSEKLSRKGVYGSKLVKYDEVNFGVTKKKGEWLLHMIMDFASCLELDYVELQDEAMIKCDKNETEVSLFWLKTMSEGLGWYEKNGFKIEPKLKKEIENFRITPVRNFDKMDLLIEERRSKCT